MISSMRRGCFVVLVVLTAAPAYAQFSTGTGRETTGGMFGSRSLGSGTNAGTRTLTGAPGDMVSQAQLDAGNVQGNERFIRDNRQPGQFVGSDSGDTQNFLSQIGGAGGFSNLRPQAGQNNGPNRSANGDQRDRPYRTTYRVAFPYARPASPAVTATLQQRLAGATSLNLAGVQVEMTGRTLILRGTATSQQNRQLAERLALLEPGVSDVQNELIVVDRIDVP